MRKVLVILSIIILNSNVTESLACKCKTIKSYDELINISYNSSNLVFLGELIKLDTLKDEYSFLVLELFKGDNKTDTIIYKPQTSCSLYISEKGRWIIYGNIINDNYIDISQCGASRSERKPTCFNCPFWKKMIPDPRLSKLEMEKHKIKVDSLQLQVLERWYNEIKLLRTKN